MKQQRPFEVIYEDGDIIAVNKAAGLAVCADRWNYTKRRLDTMVAEFCGRRLFTVHRIDAGTSGAVIFAKTASAHRQLSVAFEARQVGKVYTAAVRGVPRWETAVCDAPLVVNGDKLRRTIIDRYRGKPSLTRFRLLARCGGIALVEALPESGRTHQIRVHLASLGHPIVCDALYGSEAPLFLSALKRGWRGDRFEERPLIARLALHALSVTVRLSGRELAITAPYPRDMAALVKQLSKGRECLSPASSGASGH